MKELSMHILDIAQNSVRANAKNVHIIIKELITSNIFEFTIIDDGTGIPDEILKEIKKPFTTTRTTRKVGLGIPLLNDTCNLCGGNLRLETKVGFGTKIYANMEYNHIDRPPLGDIVSTIVGLITSNENINIYYCHCINEKTFELNTPQIKEILGDLPLSDISIYKWLKEYINENLQEINDLSKSND